MCYNSASLKITFYEYFTKSLIIKAFKNKLSKVYGTINASMEKSSSKISIFIGDPYDFTILNSNSSSKLKLNCPDGRGRLACLLARTTEFAIDAPLHCVPRRKFRQRAPANSSHLTGTKTSTIKIGFFLK